MNAREVVTLLVMEVGVLATVALAAVLTAAVAYGARKAWRATRRDLRNRIAHEQAVGHRKLRRRIASLVGRRTDTFRDVMRAETMHGWTWFYWTRRPGEPYREHTGWAPTRRCARWFLARAVLRDDRLRSSTRR